MKVGKNFAFHRVPNEYTMGMEYENATIQGVGVKTLTLLCTALVTALLLIGIIVRVGYMPFFMYIIAGITTLILQIIMNISPIKAKHLAIPYAISEGLVVGCLCGLLELVLPDMGLQLAGVALLITLAVFIGGTILYAKGYIQVGRKFKSFLIIVSLGILIFSFFFSLMALVMFLVNRVNLYSLFYMSGLGLVCSIVMCIIASMYVIVSLSNADEMIESGASKVYEWFAAYAITLNVIYLFIEVLRLLLIIVSRSREK